jgi:hypothetical protein
MSYKAFRIMSKRIEFAVSSKAITAAEGLTLSHHLQLSGRSKYRYVSAHDKALIANIAMRVRVA